MGGSSPSLLVLLLFEMILNAEDKNNDFDKPEQNPVLFNLPKS